MNRIGQNIEIDKLLKKIKKSGNYSFDWDDFAPEQNKVSQENKLDPRTQYNRLIYFLLEIEILKKIDPEMEYLVLTNLGFEVINQGGWIKYLGRKGFKQNIVLIKDIVLTIVPVLTLLFVTVNSERNSNNFSDLLNRQNQEIEKSLNIIQDDIQQLKED